LAPSAYSQQPAAAVSAQPAKPANEKASTGADSDLSDPDYAVVRVNSGGVTLRRCLELSTLNFPKVQEARAKAAKARAQLSEAHAAPFSEFTATGGLGLAPSVRGTGVYSPNSDVALSRSMGVAWQLGFEGVVPLWTFGKIDNAIDAAEAQTQVSAQEVLKAKHEVQMAVRQAYYGLQLSTDALYLVRSAMHRIDKYLERMEAKPDIDTNDVDYVKVKMNRAELTARESEALKDTEIARATLAFLIGSAAPVQIVDEPLIPIKHTLSPLVRYLDAAKLYRPEINMAHAGLLARQAQLRMQQSRYFPDLGLGLSANWMRAPEIDDQRNPFVHDPANYLHYGVGLVMRWKLDFFSQSARAAQAQADLDAMQANEQYAMGGVGVEVQTAFQQASDAARRLDAYTEATRYAKRWLVSVQQGIDVGTFDDQDIVEPAKEYALKKFARMQATFDYNMALAKLALATGWDAVAPTN
ncbi:MAG TPA: TolC family protein, partial [Polyangiaceae bacterium]|nr:TolC family protein [Polyangiaceae bacterium]